MYSESVSIRFLDTVSQSEEMNFLAEIAKAMEMVTNPYTDDHGFSIDARSNRKVKIVIWHSCKRDIFWSNIDTGYSKKLFDVISPKNYRLHDKDKEKNELSS